MSLREGPPATPDDFQALYEAAEALAAVYPNPMSPISMSKWLRPLNAEADAPRIRAKVDPQGSISSWGNVQGHPVVGLGIERGAKGGREIKLRAGGWRAWARVYREDDQVKLGDLSGIRREARREEPLFPRMVGAIPVSAAFVREVMGYIDDPGVLTPAPTPYERRLGWIGLWAP